MVVEVWFLLQHPKWMSQLCSANRGARERASVALVAVTAEGMEVWW